jgi:hypothetical protein
MPSEKAIRSICMSLLNKLPSACNRPGRRAQVWGSDLFLVSLWASIENVFTPYYVPSAYTLLVILDLYLRRR